MTDATRPPTRGLIELGSVPPIRTYVADIWARRDFAVALPVNELRKRTSDTRLGQLWYLINPALLVGVYYLIFDRILKTDRGVGGNYLGFLVVGILFFQFTQRTVMDASGALVRNRGLIRSLQFPRLLIPLSSVVAQLLEFWRAMVVLVLTLVATGAHPTWQWLWIAPLLVAQILLNFGVAALAALVGERARDLPQVLPHLFRVLFYMSGVLFSVEQFVEDEALRRAFALNPLYDVVTVARWCLLDLPATGAEVIGLVVWTVVLVGVGFEAFRRAESRIGAT